MPANKSDLEALQRALQKEEAKLMRQQASYEATKGMIAMLTKMINEGK